MAREQRRLSVISSVIYAQLLVCVGALLFAAPMAIAQSSSKPYRIGWLGSTSLTSSGNSGVKDFDQGLRDLKYVDGQNVVVVYRTADGNLAHLSRCDFVALIVDDGDAMPRIRPAHRPRLRGPHPQSHLKSHPCRPAQIPTHEMLRRFLPYSDAAGRTPFPESARPKKFL